MTFGLSIAPPSLHQFYLDINGAIEECFGIYQDDEGVTMLEEEDFDDSDKKVILDVQDEAKEVLKSQLENWESLGVSDKLKLQITWSEDLIVELEQRLREFINSQSVREHCDFLQDLLREIECVDHYRMGLHSALLVL